MHNKTKQSRAVFIEYESIDDKKKNICFYLLHEYVVMC